MNSIYSDLEAFRTSKWFGGSGELSENADLKRFQLRATFSVESNVQVVSGIFETDNSTLADFYADYKRCVIVVDETVYRLYGASISTYFEAAALPIEVLALRAWEEDKNANTIDQILDYFRAKNVSRHEPVLVIGGGVLADTAGLAAALHHRRTPYVMVGTTVISAIDAGPSPRTCVNSARFKNHMGAYHLPVLTLVDRKFFSTLSLGHIRHGMAEILKMAIVDEPRLFELMRDHGVDLLETRFASREKDTPLARIADEVIYRALRSYMGHEGLNPWEVHQARPHAYGHTWSPGFELQTGLLHGHAVSTGMSFGATLAHEIGWIDASSRDEIVNICLALGLTASHAVLSDTDLLWRAQEKMIEKRGGQLWAPLPKDRVGACGYARSVSETLLKEAVFKHQAHCARLPRGGEGIEMYLSDLGLR